MQVWNLARWNTGRKNSQKNPHMGTIAQLCWAISSQLRCVSTIGKKLLSSNISFTCLHDMVLRPTSGWDRSVVWCTPPNFNGCHVLAALLRGILVVGVSQTLRLWTEGATYIRQGDHHVGHWPIFLVSLAEQSPVYIPHHFQVLSRRDSFSALFFRGWNGIRPVKTE